MAIRDTRQRRAIQSAFEKRQHPLSPKEIVELATAEVPNLGIATVYRNVKSMVEGGELEVVEIPGQPARYCRPEDRTPVLFVCQKSERVFFVQKELAVVDFKCAPAKCRVDRTEVILYGEVHDEYLKD